MNQMYGQRTNVSIDNRAIYVNIFAVSVNPRARDLDLRQEFAYAHAERLRNGVQSPYAYLAATRFQLGYVRFRNRGMGGQVYLPPPTP